MEGGQGGGAQGTAYLSNLLLWDSAHLKDVPLQERGERGPAVSAQGCVHSCEEMGVRAPHRHAMA